MPKQRLLRERHTETIGRRFFLMLSLVAALGIGILALVLDRVILPSQIDLAEQRVRTLGKELLTIIPYLSNEETQELLENIQHVEPDLSYLLRNDRSCRALAHSNPHRVGMVFDDPQSIVSCRDGREVRQIYLRDENDPTSPFYREQVIDLNLPLYNKQGIHVGAVSLGLSLKSLEALQQRYRRILAWGAALCTVAFFLVAWLHLAEMRPIRQKLSESEVTYRTLFENSPNPLAFVASDGKIALINKEFEKLSGYGAEDIEGHMSWSQFFSPEDATSPAALHVPGVDLLAETPQRFECHFVGQGGTHRDVMATVGPIPFSEKTLVTLVDVTEKKALDREREALVAELSQKNEELESIVYVTSHDLRSPLINIQGFSRNMEKYCRQIAALLDGAQELPLLKTSLDPLVREKIPSALRFISAGGTRMGELIDGLLRLSRAGRAALNLDLVDMDTMMRHVVDAATYQIQKTGAHVEILPLPPCWADEQQISQIFSNLLDNALKYRDPQRPLRVSVSGATSDTRVLYVVEDNGRGIAPEHREKIWQLFHRLEPQESEPGEGLGLTLVRRIVERLGGKIWVESEPHSGSRFFVELPRCS